MREEVPAVDARWCGTSWEQRLPLLAMDRDRSTEPCSRAWRVLRILTVASERGYNRAGVGYSRQDRFPGAAIGQRQEHAGVISCQIAEQGSIAGSMLYWADPR